MKDVKLLDCTLRDGAHVVSARFKHDCIVDVVTELTKANTDIIEFGFLKQLDYYDPDTINYTRIEDAYSILDEAESRFDFEKKENTIYALMARADEYDINRLTPCNGKISLIRVAFYYDFLDGGIEFAKRAQDLGYKCSLNLINTPGSSMEELKVFIDKANSINVYAISMVDTFGVLSLKELEEIVNMYDKRLNINTIIGLHVHENMSLAYGLAQKFISDVQTERNIIVDGSLMGIGRAPGNLCTEIIANYLICNAGKEYNIEAFMKSINEDIKPFKKDFKWGYAPEFFLSAKYRVHRSYAEYLENKGFRLQEIDSILKLISTDKREKYDKEYIEGIMRGRGELI